MTKNKEYNIFTYAKKELGQDAVIALLCALYDSPNPDEKGLSRSFIRFLFEDDKWPKYDRLEIDTQYCNIDVLLKFYNGEDLVHYLIIEDKTDSEEHDGQIQKYIDKLRQEKVDIKNISVVYYKTGHLIESDSNIIDAYDKKNERETRWQFVNKPSEQSRLQAIRKDPKYKDLNSIKICKLEDIHNFFYKNIGLLYKSNNQILIDYYDHICFLWNEYDGGVIPADNPLSATWPKAFDEFIQEARDQQQKSGKFSKALDEFIQEASNQQKIWKFSKAFDEFIQEARNQQKSWKFSDLEFGFIKNMGQEWEIRISSKHEKKDNSSVKPVAVYKSRDPKKIIFLNNQGTPDEVIAKFTDTPTDKDKDKNNKQPDNIFKYPLGKLPSPLTIACVKALLGNVCTEYCRVLSGPKQNQPFSINVEEL